MSEVTMWFECEWGLKCGFEVDDGTVRKRTDQEPIRTDEISKIIISLG